ncbi:MAG: YciI family protein [Candidatus Kariarchaeaceae archaeon]|jgi:uncharacterized protein YciI
MPEINHYFAVIRPTRRDFIINPMEEENRIMNDHFMYLQKLLKKGKLYLAGPTLIEEDPYGILIFETDSEEEARKLLENDPSVKQGIQVIDDFRPVRLSLTR